MHRAQAPHDGPDHKYPHDRSQDSLIDLVLGEYVRAGKGWPATHVELRSGGHPFQNEDYSDWHVDVALSPALFDVNHWTAASH